jgi:hypothetical protein
MRFLPFLLLLEQLALARDVAAVALGGDVLAVGLDRFAGDDLAADRGLQGDLELVAVDLLRSLKDRGRAARPCILVADQAQRLDRGAVDQDVDLGEVGRRGSR